MIAPSIHVRKDGPIFRILVLPPDAMGKALQRPTTFTSAPSARTAAATLSGITGWPVTDLTAANC